MAIGKKNWLFLWSEAGGDAAAVLFLLVQTCRGLGIKPRENLEDVISRFVGQSHQKLHELLRDYWQNMYSNPTS